MATQPTLLPVPSESPIDLKFNAGKIDEFTTSIEQTYADRFGGKHYTIEGLRWLAQQAISKFGYIPVDSFQGGATLTLPNEMLRDTSTGEFYRWDGVFPKNVVAGSTPSSSGGVGTGKWISVGSGALGSPADGAGDSLVAVKQPSASSAIRNQHEKNLESISVKDFGAKGDNSTDDTSAFQAAATWAANQLYGAEITVPRGRYTLSAAITWNGANSNVSWRGEGVQASLLQWTSGSTTQGFAAGTTTAVSRVRVEGMQFVTSAVTAVPAITVHSSGASPKSVVLKEVTAYGGAVGGTAANGYWGKGLCYLKDPVYPQLTECYFFGVGGVSSVTKSNLIASAFLVESTLGGVFFCNFFNCFANNINNGIWLITHTNPGIEGTFINSCNFNSCNIGIYAQAQESGVSAYFPPQVFIHNSQIEYMQRGIYINHHGKVDISDNLIYADPTSDDAINHILLSDVESFDVHDNFLEGRSTDTGENGIEVTGDSINGRVHDNHIQIPSGKFGVVFAGSSSNCTQYRNTILGGGSEYANTSTNAKTNTSSTYETGGEVSTDIGHGYIQKMGSKTVTLGTGGAFSVNFNVAFPNGIISVIAVNGDSGASQTSVIVTSRSNAGFTGFFINGTSGISARVDYTVVGK